MKKGFVRAVAILLAAILLGGIIVGVVASTRAGAVSQKEIDALNERKEKIAKKQEEMEAKINSLEYEQLTAITKKEVLDEQIALTESKIDLLNLQISEYDALIRELNSEARDLQRKQDARFKLFKDRVRLMEENGTISYLEVLCNARSFTDFLTRLDFVSEIIGYDEDVYNNYLTAKNDTLAVAAETEVNRDAQEAVREELEAEKNVLLGQVREAQELIAEIQNNIDAYGAEFDEMQDMERETQAEIDRLISELKKQEATIGTTVISSGVYGWPSVSSRTVTSQFGTRYNADYGIYKTHNGIDIGAGYGTSVLASDSGLVITSTYSPSYGNYIIINHGKGNTTLYAHLSKRLVSSGDEVEKSEVIGLVGSSGIATEAQLHFEVTEDSVRVNPLKYFTDYLLDESGNNE